MPEESMERQREWNKVAPQLQSRPERLFLIHVCSPATVFPEILSLSPPPSTPHHPLYLPYNEKPGSGIGPALAWQERKGQLVREDWWFGMSGSVLAVMGARHR